MPRWPDGYIPRQKQTCPQCGGGKDFYASLCRRCTIPGKPFLGIKGEAHPAWKTGIQIDKDGYIRTYAPDHPWPRKGGYVRENDRIMELSLGRRLRPSETVHHIDEDKQNNSPDNLQLIDRGAHSRLHRAKDKHLAIRDESGRYQPRKEVQNAGE